MSHLSAVPAHAIVIAARADARTYVVRRDGIVTHLICHCDDGWQVLRMKPDPQGRPDYYVKAGGRSGLYKTPEAAAKAYRLIVDDWSHVAR